MRPSSVRSEDAPHPDLSEIRGKKPMLAVCYGAQYLAHFSGGKVAPSNTREYGRANLSFIKDNETFFSRKPTIVFFNIVTTLVHLTTEEEPHGRCKIQFNMGGTTLSKDSSNDLQQAEPTDAPSSCSGLS